MQDLTVIGVENGALVAASNDGTRFRIAINETLRSKLREATPPPGNVRKPAPREIQAQIRSGLSAEEVAAVTGVNLDYIRKFEGPVLAEREFVIESALNVAVHTASDTDPMQQGSTFGSVIRGRLNDLGATGERWASWKQPDGAWVVKLAFTADQIDHDARWNYEPKRAALAPMNNEANTLSQQGEMPGGLIPRLRAVSGDERAPDSSRFDSGAFDVRTGDTDRESVSHFEPVPFGRATGSSPEVSAAAINRAPTNDSSSSQTSDLLDALRRRRGERENAASWTDEDTRVAHPSTSNVRLVDIPFDPFDAPVDDDRTRGHVDTAPQPITSPAKASAKKGRASMPSWDEIVFGARSDDDPV